MASYESPGTENLRADASVKAGADTASPSGSGKDAGGTANLGTSAVTKRAEIKQAVAPQRSIDIPGGVQSFDDDMGKN